MFASGKKVGGDLDYTDVSGNDAATDVTGAELETLTDASETTLHSHAAAAGGFDSRAKVQIAVATTQAITTGTWTKVEFDQEDYDNLNEYDPATNYVFTATVAGYYRATASVAIDSLGTGKIGMIRLNQNGAGVGKDDPFGYASALGADVYITLASSYYLAANDTLEVEVWHNHGSNRNLIFPSIFTVERFA